MKGSNIIDDSGEIKLKSKDDLYKKKFFDTKQNKYRVKKLIKQNEILCKPDFDIELDELRFTKMKKYKEYSLVKLTQAELKKILPNYEIKEESYLPFLGINKIDEENYSLQLDIYLDKFIRINLKEITFEENLDVIFKMFDKDNNGSISKNEAKELINHFNQINNLNFEKETIEVISSNIFKDIDRSNRGSISKEVLSKYLEKFKKEDISINPFIKVKTSDAITKLRKTNTLPMSEEEEKLLERITRKKDRSKFRKFWVLNKKMIIWTIIYFFLCLTAGLVNRSLEGGRQYATTKAARFFAGIIFFNTSLLIIFMCITTLSFISTTRLKFYLPLNDTRLYHIVCASVLAAATIPHVLLHICGDFVEIQKLTSKKPKDAYVTVAWLTFATETGLSGVFCLIFFSIIIILPSIPAVRNKRYELFLNTHKLFYLALAALLIHAKTPDTKRKPYFVFLSLPLVLFIIELIFRFVRYLINKSKIMKIKYLHSGVILLEIQKPQKFNFRCGQYAQICIPAISKLQWHPFTIASSPYDDNLYFYVNPAGDWTKQLKELAFKKSINLLSNLNKF